MSFFGNLSGAALVTLNVSWFSESVGYISGSLMSGDPKWAPIGSMAGGWARVR